MNKNSKQRKIGEKVVVELSRPDARMLVDLLARGRENVRVFKRARALQLMGEGKSPVVAGRAIGLNRETVRRVAKRYQGAGLDDALHERSRPGQKRALDSRQEAKLVALCCSSPPLDQARWTIPLLRKEMLRRGICKKVGETTIRKTLKNHAIRPWREKKLVRRGNHAGVSSEDGRRPGDV